MAAGVFGYIGYDMVRFMEDLPEPNPDVLGLPDGMLIRPTVMAIFDSVKDEVTVVTPVYPEQGRRAKAAYARALERIAKSSMRSTGRSTMRSERAETPAIGDPRSNTTPEEYKAMVLRAKDYIAAGDIFQAVLSQRFETRLHAPALRALSLAAARQSLAVPLLSSTSTASRSSALGRRSW